MKKLLSFNKEKTSSQNIPASLAIDNSSIKAKSYKNNQNTPPDLDEVIDKLKESIFGKKTNSYQRSQGSADGDSNTPPKYSTGFSFSPKIIVYILVIVFLIWLASGFYIVNPAERGVVLRFGDYIKTAIPGPNWHLPYPIAQAYIVNVDQIRNAEIGYRSGQSNRTQSSIVSESLMLTIDENIVDVKLAVQYQVSNAQSYLFNVRDPDVTLIQAVESAIRETVGKNSLNFVLTNGRDQVAQLTMQLAQDILDRYKTGLTITSINMQDAQPPEQVQDAFNDAVRAREDQQRLINQAEAYRNDIIPKARGLSARMIKEAEAYTSQVVAIANGESERFLSIYGAYKQRPEVTRKRLYIETMEQVLNNTPKIVVDNKNSQLINLINSGNNNFLKNFIPDNQNDNTNNNSNNSNNLNNSNPTNNRNSDIYGRMERAIERITRTQQP